MAVTKVTQQNFQEEVVQADVPVLVDFFATWCAPCQMLAPVLEEVAEEVEGRAKVVKVDVDEEQQLASLYGVMSIPTLLVFKNGEVAEQSVGAKPKADLLAMLQ